MTEHENVEVAVVGSGFGGSVAAYRLAEAGTEVVVLERGAPYPPGSFPRTPADMKRAFWDPSEGLGGMFDVWSFGGFSSVVSSGLGGGSLIYANVLLRKDEHWFVHDDPLPGGGYETWPVSRADLDPHYDAVEAMLTPTPYPFAQPAYADTPKTRTIVDAAGRLGLDVTHPPLAVSFAAGPGHPPGIGLPLAEGPYPNLHGLQRFTCRLCGECDIGCNAGSKNTLDHTYLSAAEAKGADIRTRCEVRSLRPVDGGYELRYVRHSETPTGRRTAARALPEHVLTARRVVLGGRPARAQPPTARPKMSPAIASTSASETPAQASGLAAQEGLCPRIVARTWFRIASSHVRELACPASATTRTAAPAATAARISARALGSASRPRIRWASTGAASPPSISGTEPSTLVF